MPPTVIVPLDGFSAAEAALPHAQELARRTGAGLHLISVINVTPQLELWVASSGMTLDTELEKWIAEREAYLDGIAVDAPNVTRSVEIGNPAAVIRKTVEETEDPMVVMTSHGRSGVQQIVMGSVAFKIVHDATCPVVIVRIRGEDEEAAPATYERVLFPIDDEELSSKVFDRALHAIGEPKPKVRLLNVVETPDWVVDPVHLGLVGEYLDATREIVDDLLAKQASKLEAAGYEVEFEVRHGPAHQAILESAEEFGAGMIAMATHGRGNIGRALIGSVSQRVVQNADLPVMLIRPRAE